MSNPTASRSQREQRLEQLLADYLRSVEAGQPLAREHLVAANPDLADDLRSFFANRDAMQQLVQPLRTPVDTPTIGLTPSTDGKQRVRYFGDYELIEEIARGGMGVVYKARQVNLKRTVALKMILAGQLASQQEVERFHAEAEAAAKLDHPNIVPIYEVGQHEGQHYFSMAFVAGESLAHKVARGVLPPQEAAGLTRQVALAIAYAHVAGVVHRDLKPANILLDRDGQPRVTDFGLAKQVEAGDGPTLSGQVLGTPSYMPPEQASGERGKVGPQSDIYSLGAILYCLLTGRPPFQAATPVDTLLQVMSREPASPRQLNAAVPRDLETICLKCLEKEPSRRYPSAQELADELQRYLEGRPIQARPLSAPARAARWCRRNPVIAGLTAAVAASLLIGTIVSASLAVVAQNRATDARQSAALANEEALRADRNSQAAKAQQALAEKNAEQADKNAAAAREETIRALRHLYVAHMNQAQAAWDSGDIHRLRALLVEQQARRGIFDPLTLAKLNLQPGQKWTAAETTRLQDLLAAKRLKTPADFDPRGWEWHYWMRAMHSYVRKFEFPAAQTVRIDRFALTPDGTRLVGVCDHEPKAFTWEVRTGKLLATQVFPATKGTMTLLSQDANRVAIVYRPNFSHPAGQSFDAVVRNVADGQVVHTFPKLGLVRTAAFDAKGEHLVVAKHVADDLGALRVFVYSIHSTDSPVELAGQVPVKEVVKGQKLEGLYPHRSFLLVLAVSPDGKQIVSSGRGETSALVWDTATGKLLHTLAGHNQSVLSVRFLPDGRRLATAALDRTTKVWDIQTGECLKSLAGHPEELVEHLASSSDGRLLASVGGEKTIRVWGLDWADTRAVIQGHEGTIRDLLFSGPDEVTTLDDAGIRTWKIAHDQTARIFERTGIAGWKVGLVFNPSGEQLSVIGPEIRTWDLSSGRVVRTLDPTSGRNGRTKALSPDGRHYAWTDYSAVEIYECDTGRRLFTVPTGHTDFFDAVALSTGARYLATGSQDKTVKLWRLTAEGGHAELIATHQGFSGGYQQLLFTPDASLLIAAGQSPEVRVWHVKTGQPHPLAGSFQQKVAHIALSADGKLLAAASENQGHTRLWNLASGELLDMLPTGTAKSIAFHPDGTRLATAHGELGVKLWDIATGQEVLTLGQQRSGYNFTAPTAFNDFNQVAFSPTGHQLAAANNYGAVKVWDATPVKEPTP